MTSPETSGVYQFCIAPPGVRGADITGVFQQRPVQDGVPVCTTLPQETSAARHHRTWQNRRHYRSVCRVTWTYVPYVTVDLMRPYVIVNLMRDETIWNEIVTL